MRERVFVPKHSTSWLQPERATSVTHPCDVWRWPKDAGGAAYFSLLELSLEDEVPDLEVSALLSEPPDLPSEDDEDEEPFPLEAPELPLFLA